MGKTDTSERDSVCACCHDFTAHLKSNFQIIFICKEKQSRRGTSSLAKNYMES
ncbi:MAG: hypothetical protein WCJ01_01530 [Ignavibacteria bacterium]